MHVCVCVCVCTTCPTISLSNNERGPRLKVSTGMESASPGLFSVSAPRTSGAILLFIPYLWISIDHFLIYKNRAELRISIIHFRIDP